MARWDTYQRCVGLFGFAAHFNPVTVVRYTKKYADEAMHTSHPVLSLLLTELASTYLFPSLFCPNTFWVLHLESMHSLNPPSKVDTSLQTGQKVCLWISGGPKEPWAFDPHSVWTDWLVGIWEEFGWATCLVCSCGTPCILSQLLMSSQQMHR